MSSFEHILLCLFSFLLMALWGINNHRKESIIYWLSATIPLVSIAFIIGSRTWGADYLWYKYQFQHAYDSLMLQEQQFLFVYFNRFLTMCGLNYVGAFTVYSLIYFISAFKLYKSFGKYSKYMYAFLLPAYIGFGTDIIRQSIAIGFIILCILECNKQNYKKAILFFIVAVMIHSASAIILSFYLLFKFAYKKPLPIKITIPSYLIIAFFFKSEWLYGLEKLFIILNLGDSKFQGYIDNTDRWFSTNAMNSIYTQGTEALLLNTIFTISLFYIGYRALEIRKNNNITTIYNMVVAGYIGWRFFFNLEILRRFFIPNTMLYPVVLGYAIYIFQRIKKNKTSDFNIIFLCHIMIFLWLFLYWGRFIFLTPKYKFFWQ